MAVKAWDRVVLNLIYMQIIYAGILELSWIFWRYIDTLKVGILIRLITSVFNCLYDRPVYVKWIVVLNPKFIARLRYTACNRICNTNYWITYISTVIAYSAGQLRVSDLWQAVLSFHSVIVTDHFCVKFIRRIITWNTEEFWVDIFWKRNAFPRGPMQYSTEWGETPLVHDPLEC